MTGGAQSWVDTNYPGAFYKPHGVSYVCVGGKTVTGQQRDKSNKAEKPSPSSYAFNAYTQACSPRCVSCASSAGSVSRSTTVTVTGHDVLSPGLNAFLVAHRTRAHGVPARASCYSFHGCCGHGMHAQSTLTSAQSQVSVRRCPLCEKKHQHPSAVLLARISSMRAASWQFRA